MIYSLIRKLDDFIVIDKQEPSEFHGEDGILNAVRGEFPNALGVHRLDRETTGIMLFALSKKSQSELSTLFEQKKIKKCYLAVSKTKPSKRQGMIKGDIEKTRSGSYALRRTLTNPSSTKFKSFFDESSGLRLFKLYPLTGRTHQLRVVMKSLGSTILGDLRYGNEPSDRMYLHAARINFIYNNVPFDFRSYPTGGDLFVNLSPEGKNFLIS